MQNGALGVWDEEEMFIPFFVVFVICVCILVGRMDGMGGRLCPLCSGVCKSGCCTDFAKRESGGVGLYIMSFGFLLLAKYNEKVDFI